MEERIDLSKTVRFFEKIRLLFFWLRFFYPKSKGTPIAYQLYFFVPQKLFRLNGKVPWVVHFTSRIIRPDKITVGNFCNPGGSSCCYIQAKNGIEIGHNLRMGPNVGLISANHDPSDYDKWIKTDPIRIGDNVWIGMGAIVMPGVEIGDNVVIAANSVVTENIPDNSIAAGTPCRVIRSKGQYTGMDYSKL